jgi:hypothetical protein
MRALPEGAGDVPAGVGDAPTLDVFVAGAGLPGLAEAAVVPPIAGCSVRAVVALVAGAGGAADRDPGRGAGGFTAEVGAFVGAGEGVGASSAPHTAA